MPGTLSLETIRAGDCGRSRQILLYIDLLWLVSITLTINCCSAAIIGAGNICLQRRRLHERRLEGHPYAAGQHQREGSNESGTIRAWFQVCASLDR